MAYPTCKFGAVARVVMGDGLGNDIVHVQLCSRFGVLCERFLLLFIDQRRAQLLLEVERKSKQLLEIYRKTKQRLELNRKAPQ